MSAAERGAEREAAAAQGDLFGPAVVSGRGPRRVELAVGAAVDEGVRQGVVTSLDGGLAALAVECARAVDVASGRNDPYGVAAAAQRLAEALTRLKLDPTAREAARPDDVASFLAGLSAPTLGNPPQP